MNWTDERVETLKKTMGRRPLRVADRGRARRHHPQRGDRQGASPRTFRPRQVRDIGGAAPAQAALVPDAARIATGSARQHGARSGVRIRSRSRARNGRERHPDRPAAHVARTERKHLPVADRRSGLSGLLLLRRTGEHSLDLIARFTRASLISRPTCGATGGRSEDSGTGCASRHDTCRELRTFPRTGDHLARPIMRAPRSNAKDALVRTGARETRFNQTYAGGAADDPSGPVSPSSRAQRFLRTAAPPAPMSGRPPLRCIDKQDVLPATSAGMTGDVLHRRYAARIQPELRRASGPREAASN